LNKNFIINRKKEEDKNKLLKKVQVKVAQPHWVELVQNSRVRGPLIYIFFSFDKVVHVYFKLNSMDNMARTHELMFIPHACML
jgi:hypothetical protein